MTTRLEDPKTTDDLVIRVAASGPWSPPTAVRRSTVKTLARADLTAADWTVAIPAGVTAALERQGFQ